MKARSRSGCVACTCHGEDGEGYSRGTHSSRSRSKTRTRSKSGSGGQGRGRSRISRMSTFSSRSRSQSPSGSRSRSRSVQPGQDMEMMPCMRRKFLDGEKSGHKNTRQSRSRSRSVNHGKGRGRSSTRKSTFASRSRSRSPSENRSKLHLGQDMKLMPSLAQKGLAREKAKAEGHWKAGQSEPSSPKPSILKKPDHPEVKTVITIPIRPVSPSWRYGNQAQISNKENCRVCAPHPFVMQKGSHTDGKPPINVPITVHGPKPQIQGLKHNPPALKSSTKVDINIATPGSACDHFGYAALPCCFDFNLTNSSTSKSSYRKEKRSSSVHLYQMNSNGKFV